MKDGENTVLSPPKEFPFPFQPYPIQEDFMRNLYMALEYGKLGIFESPTGTGKTLSLICGTLQWLRDHEERERCVLTQKIQNLSLTVKNSQTINSDDWLNEQAQTVKISNELKQLQHMLNKMNLKDERISLLRSKKNKILEKKINRQALAVKSDSSTINTNVLSEDKSVEKCEDDDLVLEDCQALDDSSDSEPDEEKVEEEEYLGTKVYFCSRTHSQLSQFVGEVQRSSFSKDIRLVSLASRQNYCINKSVNKFKSVTLINEKCLDLQRKKKGNSTSKDEEGKTVKKSKCSSGCPYRLQKSIEQLRDEILTSIEDVEQLVSNSIHHSACPYYASRASIKDAQVVAVPYNTILHKFTREACGIRLRDSVVIIDEAHNLLDTIAHLYSAEVTGRQLTQVYSQLSQYRNRYESRFSAVNLLCLNQVIFIVSQLIKILGGKPGCNPVEAAQKVVDTKLYTLPDFVVTAEIDNLNLYKLLDFCRKSKIAQKLHGYSERYDSSVHVMNNSSKSDHKGGIRAFLNQLSSNKKENISQQENTQQAVSNHSSTSGILSLISFIESLTNHCEDGRIVCCRQETVGRGSLKFLLLNPASHFSEVIREARSVIVAGGTMQPFEEFKDQLFLSAGADVSRVTEFSCGHVIPPENILPIALATGPTGKDLDFSFSSRNSVVMLNELGRLLLNVCSVIPAGVVCFFPSYEYEKLAYQHLEKTEVLSKLQIRKKIFREPKTSGLVDQVLSDYAASINSCKGISKGGLTGALMFSVVGGKLSEGLNFSDDLGRCIILVGLPYPNIKSPELQEKINYLNSNVKSGAGQVHYENLCMKAVNQSIGRAVRHRNDYSTVLLLDQRYTRPHTQNGLPSWIRRSLQTHFKFGPALAQLAKFFSAKNSTRKN